MLSEEQVLWLIDMAKTARKRWDDDSVGGKIFDERLSKIQAELEQPVKPLELLIHCPRCLKQHIDEGRFATDPHKIHSCQFCGLGFVASKQPSIGVQFFDGWKNPVVGWLLGDSGKPPAVSPPLGYHLVQDPGYLRHGLKVRFKEEAREMGYDTTKEFEVETVSSQLSVRLKDDPLPVPYSLLEPVPTI